MKKYIIASLFIILSLAIQAQKKSLIIASSGNAPGLDKDIAAYISTKLKIPVKTVVISRMTQMTKAFQQNKVDLAFINTFGYLLVRNSLHQKVIPLVVFGKNGIPGSYTSSLISYKGSPIHTISDIISHAKEINFVLASPTSTSGHIIPRLFLQTKGIESMEKSFKSVKFAGSHPKVIEMVGKHEAQIGAIATGFLGTAIKDGKIKSSDYVVLWTSGPIIEGPLIANSTVTSTQKLMIQQILIKMPHENPKLWAEITNVYRSAKISGGYIVAQDSYYNSVRRMIRHIDNLRAILKYYFAKYY